MTPLYRWTPPEKALLALEKNVLGVPRWSHFIELENRFVKGTSWSLDHDRWQRDGMVCLVADRDLLANKIHSISGSRTFWLTKGMIDKNADPEAYKLEPTATDEEFVEGKVEKLRQKLIGIWMPEPNEKMTAIAAKYGIEMLEEPKNAVTPRGP